MSIKTVEFINDLVVSRAMDDNQSPHKPQNHPALIFFHAAWAEQCKVMESVVQELANMYSDRVAFFKVDAEAIPEVADMFTVKAVPCFILTEPDLKTVVGRVEGAKPAELLHAIKSLVNHKSSSFDLDQKCDQLLKSHKLMLFIKGTPTEPRCGFTTQLMALLRTHNINDFGYYNILEDEPLRQHLKVRSQWPTYPQVYHHGELVGGLDILKEMAANGELSLLAQ